jgi:hypothetical protein
MILDDIIIEFDSMNEAVKWFISDERTHNFIRLGITLNASKCKFLDTHACKMVEKAMRKNKITDFDLSYANEPLFQKLCTTLMTHDQCDVTKKINKKVYENIKQGKTVLNSMILTNE